MAVREAVYRVEASGKVPEKSLPEVLIPFSLHLDHNRSPPKFPHDLHVPLHLDYCEMKPSPIQILAENNVFWPRRAGVSQLGRLVAASPSVLISRSDADYVLCVQIPLSFSTYSKHCAEL